MTPAARPLRAAAAALLLGALPARGAPVVGVELWGGAPWNAPLPLRVAQAGAPALQVHPRWETSPLEPPPYYRLRLTLGAGERGEWALELVHHKLYLVDPPPEIESFSVSHGYNLVLASRGWELGALWLRAGAGPVVAHPESTVRGRTVDPHAGVLRSGYHLSGAAVAVMAERRFRVAGPVHLALGLMATAAAARVPIAAGHADVPNVALHALAGVAVRGARR